MVCSMITITENMTYLICENAHVCDNLVCPYLKPHPGCEEIHDTMCGHIKQKVNVLFYEQLEKTNPNYQFKRKRNGL
jgi:hypothetical protein